MSPSTSLSYSAAVVLQAVANEYRYGFDIMDMTGLPSGTVYAVLLSAMPYKDAERLVILRETVGKDGWGSVAYPNFLDWKTQSTAFEDMAAYTEAALNLSGREK